MLAEAAREEPPVGVEEQARTRAWPVHRDAVGPAIVLDGLPHPGRERRRQVRAGLYDSVPFEHRGRRFVRGGLRDGGAGSPGRLFGGARVPKERHRKERDGRQQSRENESQPDPTSPFTQLTRPRQVARQGPMPFGQHPLPSLSGTYPTGEE
jgi:hypothetical protein